MLQAQATLDSRLTIGPVNRRLFGSFVEHLGRCVYGGIFDPDSPSADENGFSRDVLALVRELGVTTVRYPGGNFVSGYRWEDGVGPRDARPTGLNLAWHQTEPNTFGLHEFIDWAREAGVEPMLTLNLGTRGIADALDLLEYANHPGGTTLADRRRENGATEPFGVRLWCLGNEPDGPWQLGHMTALEYGRLAAETARAMRQFDPSLELVVAGSTAPWLPSSADWDSIVLRETLEFADFVAVHGYYEETDGDLASFLASGLELGRSIDHAVAVADETAAILGLDRQIAVSVDEWGIWRNHVWNEAPPPDWPLERPIGESPYTEGDAVVAGGLLMTLLERADRVTCACQSLLVNAGAPIRVEADAVWRQSIFHPIALTARHARGVALRVATTGPSVETAKHGPVPTVAAVGTLDEDAGEAALFLLNRHDSEAVEVSVALPASGKARVVESLVVGGRDPHAVNTADDPERIAPRPGNASVSDSRLRTVLPPVSWSVVRLVLPGPDRP